MCLLEEANAGANLVRDQPPRELHLQLERLIVRAIEHGDVAQLFAFIAQLEDALRDERRLFEHVIDADDCRIGTAAAHGAQLFLKLKAIVRDRVICELQDLRRGAVICLQLVDLRVGEAHRKGDDVLERSAAKRVDRLGVVAHHHHVGPHAGHRIDHFGLQLVRVLVLVDEDVAEFAFQHCRDVVMLVEQQFPVDEEVVEVHRIGFALSIFVASEDADNLLLVDREMGVVFLEMQLQRGARVDQKGIDVEQDVAFRESPLERFDAEGRDGAVHHFFGVFIVENRKIRAIADRLGVVAEQAIADRVERAAPDATGIDGDELLDAAQHLAGSLVGEGQQQDVLRIDAILDEPRHAVGEGARLAAAGAGDDQQRSLAGHHHFELLGVELLVVPDPVRFLRFGGLLERVAADFLHSAQCPVPSAQRTLLGTGHWVLGTYYCRSTRTSFSADMM